MRAGWLVCALALCAPVARAADGACAPDAAILKTGTGALVRFGVEIAATAETRARGLMFRDHLAASQGMLFVYDRPQHARFWMKNTEIPLDMIFFDQAGRVTRVAANAQPFDETVIDGGEGVLLVLEVQGGLAQRLGVAPGAWLRHPRVPQTGAAWPCPD